MLKSFLNNYLLKNNSRKIIIGALFGKTPTTFERLKTPDKKGNDFWEKNSQGFICPFIKCPNENCYGDIVENGCGDIV